MANVRELILKKQIQNMPNLPTLSTNVMQILKLLNDPNTIFEVIVQELKKDPVLVGSMLKLINSGFYSLRQSVHSVENAVSLLGMKNVKNLVLSSSVMDMLSESDKEIWAHSYSTSLLAQEIINKENLFISENFSLMVLLHDLGQVVLRLFNPRGCDMVKKMSFEENVPIEIAERNILQLDHAKVSKWLLELWQLEEDILYVVGEHTSDKVPEFYVTEVILLQFVNAIDNLARKNIAALPSPAQLNAAGLNDILFDTWLEFQKKNIETLEKTDSTCAV